MLAKGNVKVTDLLCPPFRQAIPDGSHAMTQLVELPPADPGPRATSPLRAGFRVCTGGPDLFELEGEAPGKS